jgi:hypothetical protein
MAEQQEKNRPAAIANDHRYGPGSCHYAMGLQECER